MRIALRLAVLLAIAATAACGDATPPGPPQQLTALPRPLTGDEQRVAGAANQFAFSLFTRLAAAQPNDNVFVSPLSVSFSLGMALNGAGGTTFDQMRATLGFGAAELQQINDGYRGLLALQGGLDPSTTFDIANSVWYRQNFTFHQAFITRVQQVFDAQVTASPFDESTKHAVNAWVNQQTNGRIPTILDAIAPDNVMFLINAIYFKGSWREQFDPARTTGQPFQAKGGVQTVPTMARPEKTGTIRYGGSPGVTVGELSYGNGAFVMTLLMPTDPNGIDALVASLDTTRFSALVAGMREADYRVELPKFTMSYERTLNDDLAALGMVDPFSDVNASFPGMTPAQVYISFVKHKTFVDVNEEGTEAAAVTNTGVSVTSMPPCLCVNRPFVFVIRERFSGTILFMGRMLRIPG